MRRAMILTVATALVVGATGCGSSNKTVTPPVRGTIDIELTKSGCKPQHLRVQPGLTRFKVANTDATAVNQLRVADQRNRTVGQIVNLTPGLSGTFTITLQPGTYSTSCPGGTGAAAQGDIIVKGATATTTTRPLTPAAQAVSTYRAYAEKEAELLVRATGRFVRAVKNHDIAQAKRLYPTARVHYERIEPIAKRFGTLHPLIDGPVAGDSAQQFGGFHRIELQLWRVGQIAGTEWIADALLSNVSRLQDRIPELALSPETLAGGAAELIDEIATRKITGVEDPYSHTDLSDFEANLIGVEQDVDALRPLIAAKSPPLLTAIAERVSVTKSELAKYRKGDGFILYTRLSNSDTRRLAAQLSALAAELTKVEPLVRS